ncbi:SGS domain-containing protein [Bisporella sp. PMI_857]|nr:SGS domain-containing protein [Bisporella sp. PMI_857]
MATQADLGKKAILAKDYNTAIEQFTAAIRTNLSNPNPQWLLERGTSYQRLGKHELALADAESAYHAGQHRGKRDAMATAQLRRALALHGLKRFGDARLCLNWALKLNEKEKGVTIWMSKVKADYEAAEKSDPEGPAVKTSVKEVPEKVAVKVDESSSGSSGVNKENVKPAPVLSVPQTQTTQKEKIRTEFFQTQTNVTITIFAKNVPKDTAEVIIKEGSLEVRFPTSAADTYDYTIDPLFQRIVPATSSFRVTPHKIEINLTKAQAGVKWAGPEGTEAITDTADEAANSRPTTESAPVQDKPPAYPTSSKSGPKNWESMANEVDDKEQPDDPDNWFKQLYAGADPDTKRAMIKSYQESNGTALSTDWSSVSKQTVKTEPPEGLIAKKWDE